MTNKKKYTFFWRGEFSQWHPAEFVLDGVTYNCAEQYMMANKAKLFGDNISFGKIMKSTHPKEQKNLGRNVCDFDLSIWDKHCKKIVFKGNLAKFSQNAGLKECLRDTIGTLLVEASPYDKIWGIGMGLKDPLINDEKSWKGTNYLGVVLTAVRKKIFNHEYDECFENINTL